MIFSTKTIQSLNNRKLNDKSINYNEPLFFNEFLEMSLHESLESKSLILNVFNEGFISNYFSKITNSIIDKFKHIMVKIYDKAIDFIISTTRKSKVIDKYRNELKTIDIEIDYGDRRYIGYNNLNISIISNIRKILNSLYDTFKKSIEEIEKLKSTEDIVSSISDNMITFDEDYYNSIRHEIVGLSRPGYKEDYSKDILDSFINERTNMEYLRPGIVRKAMNDYDNYEADKKKIEKEKSDIKKVCDEFKDKFAKLKFDKKSAIESNPEINKGYDSIIKKYCDAIKELCNIFGIYISTKLDIMKEKRNQDKDILIAACRTLAKKKGDNEK